MGRKKMTEYEFLDVIGQHTDTMISLLQWWVGITLGILVSVHVIGKDLNGYIASLLTAVFVSFTAVISFISNAHKVRQQLLIDDLAQLQEQGTPLGQMARSAIENSGPSPLVEIFGIIGFWGLFLSTVAYITYCYRKAKQADG
jgi:hypothetical protein